MKRLLVGGAIAGLAVAGMTASSAAPAQWKVTGGGQIILDPAATGPGQTLAFNAQTTGDGDAARGQLQFNDHAGTKLHGQVTCLDVTPADPDNDSPAMANIGGTYDTADGPLNFRLTVTDNGQGQSEDDVVIFEQDSDPGCDTADGDETALGRGNIVIHKEKAPKDGS